VSPKRTVFVYVFVVFALCLAPARSQQLPSEPKQPQVDTVTGPQIESDQITDSNTDPNVPELLPAVSLHPDANEPPMPRWSGPGEYWQPKYHPQVTERVFRVLSYPYYSGSSSYPVTDIGDLATVDLSKPSVDSDAETSAQNEVASDDEKPTDPNVATSGAVSLADPDKLRFTIEKCCDLIHQWRSINESVGTTTEVVRAMELTRTTTNIYRLQPELAVQVKRTIGQIGRINRNFDLTSRLAVKAALSSHIDKVLLARMEKQLADLHTVLEQLVERNDQIGIALGIGKVNRSRPPDEPIDYSNL